HPTPRATTRRRGLGAHMSRVVILTPWRTDHGPREDIYQLVRDQTAGLGLEVFEGDSDTDVFSTARAWNSAAKAAGDWDIAIQWGADMLLKDPTSALRAAEACTPETPYVMAFNKCLKLTPQQT